MIYKIICHSLFVLALCLTTLAQAYEYEAGDVVVREGFGGRINVLRYNPNGSGTPPAGFVWSTEVDWLLDKNWSLGFAVRPTFFADYIDLPIGPVARYRAGDLGAPLVPYISLALQGEFLIPVNGGNFHFNLGIRPAIGLEYFLLRDFIIGFEVATEPGLAFVNSNSYWEWSVEPLFVLGLRF